MDLKVYVHVVFWSLCFGEVGRQAELVTTQPFIVGVNKTREPQKHHAFCICGICLAHFICRFLKFSGFLLHFALSKTNYLRAQITLISKVCSNILLLSLIQYVVIAANLVAHNYQDM